MTASIERIPLLPRLVEMRPRAELAPRPGRVPEPWSAYKINLDVLNSRLTRRPGAQGLPEAVDVLLADGPGSERTFSRLQEAEQRHVPLRSDAEIKADAVRRFVKAG